MPNRGDEIEIVFKSNGVVNKRIAVSDNTVVMALIATLLVGLVAAAGPALQASTVKVSEGFRAVG